MQVKPSAVFDILFICNSIEKIYRDFSSFELNFLSYYACLMSLYDGNPATSWEYMFYKNKNGVPVASAIMEALDAMTDNNEIRRDKNYYGITDVGKENLERYKSFEVFSRRIKYLSAACDCLLTDSIVTLSSTVLMEPLIKESIQHKMKPLNSDNNGALASLHSHFAIIQEVVGNQKELYVPAYMWLQYLKFSKENDTRATNNKTATG